MLLLGAEAVKAQNIQTESGQEVPEEAEQYFKGLIPKKDSAFVQHADYPDNTLKRFSFHFNLIDWAMTVPSVGVEFDLSPSTKNNRSVLVFGKYNGQSKQSNVIPQLNAQPSINFNMASARVEFRKYWRTGCEGKTYNNKYPRISLEWPKDLPLDTFMYREQISYYEHRLQDIADSINAEEKGLYFVSRNKDTIPPSLELRPLTRSDSAMIRRYNGDPYGSWLYNHYHRFRRNVTSGRTLQKTRSWRAYYAGAYAGVDKYNMCFNKKGLQGTGIFLGATGGWSIPILTQKFPNEGGLDLDLGMLLGLKMVKYDAYNYISESSCYAYDAGRSKTSWTFVPAPVVQELRVSLVYRFRSISRKVSREIIDDYDKEWVTPFNERVDSKRAELRDYLRVLQDSLVAIEEGRVSFADSASFWNDFHKRRLEKAILINPDTIFTGQNDTLYQKLFKGIDLTKKSDIKMLEEQRRAKEKAEQDLKKQAEKQRKEQEKTEKKNSKKKDEAPAVESGEDTGSEEQAEAQEEQAAEPSEEETTAESESEQEQEPEEDNDSGQEQEQEPEPDNESEPEQEPEADNESEPEQEPEADNKPETEQEPEADNEPETEQEPEADNE